MKTKVAIVVPNWNGADYIASCLRSIESQSLKADIIVVDNGSVDGSVGLLEKEFPKITLLKNNKNYGFSGGVNRGIEQAIDMDADYVALFNNDALADKNWLKELVTCLQENPKTAIATCKFLDSKGKSFDSTGDIYTTWGLSYPRGRGEPVSSTYDKHTLVFGASGGASLYRTSLFKEIGLFDKEFFAYFEDVDISFRAQLAGWQVRYVPSALAYHQISATTGKIKGFGTYHTLKNLPLLLWKNVPARLLPTILPRFLLAYTMFLFSALIRGQGWFAFKGVLVSLWWLPKKLVQRRKIQSTRKVDAQYIASVITWDLPPNAHKLRSLRAKWHTLIGKNI